MKKTAMMILPVFFAFLSGCATSDTFLGLPTTAYINSRLGERDDRIRENDLKISSTRAEMSAEITANKEIIDDVTSRLSSIDSEVSSVKNQIQSIERLSTEVSMLGKRTDQIENYTHSLEQRLGTLPKETLRQLVTVLENFLNTDIDTFAKVQASPRSVETPPEAKTAAGMPVTEENNKGISEETSSVELYGIE